MAIGLKPVLYKDLAMSFVIHPITGQPSVYKNEYAISQSIKNLLLTNKYERPFRPYLHSNIGFSLFDNFDPITVDILKTNIRNVIQNYEPRAELLSVDIVNDLDNNGLDITVTYSPVNTKDPVIIDIFLERIR